MTSIRRFGWTSLALIALVGCGESAAPTAPANPTSTPPGTADEAKPEPKKEGASVEKLSDEEIAQIKKLPATEQPIALAQVVCPVSDEHLGMAVPIKQVIGDKTFYICCSHCEEKVKSSPDTVLAKLKK